MSGDMSTMKNEFIGLRVTVKDLDSNINNMYQLMSDDLDSMRSSIELMAPSIAIMSRDMNIMRNDMSRGVQSFTSPTNYIRGMLD